MAFTGLMLLCISGFAGTFEKGMDAEAKGELKQAVEYYRIAAIQEGNPGAQNNLGACMSRGKA